MKTSSLLASRIVLVVWAFCLSAFKLFAASEQVVVTSFGSTGSASDYINSFELFQNGLYWTEGRGDCSVEFRSETKFGILGVIGGSPRRILSTCQIQFGGQTRDDTYAFYTHDGRLWRKSVNSVPTDPESEILAPPYTPIPAKYEMGAMTLWNGRVYWSDSNGSFFDILSVKEDGTDARYELLGSDSKIVKMQIVSYNPTVLFDPPIVGLFLLTSSGKLLKYDLDPKATRIQTLATEVTDFCIRDESSSSGLFFTRSTAVYASTGLRFQIQPSTPPGQVLRINAASGVTKSIHTAAAQSQVTSIACDSTAIYIVEQPVVGCDGLFGCILGGSNMKRQDYAAHNGNSTNPYDLIDVSDGTLFNLRSDEQWLYFIAGTQVRRIRTDSPALQIDVAADNLEIVQAVQNLNNDVRLVANKRTFARGYAHFTVNTTGKSPWFPGASLHGFRNGLELPDSPLDPINFTGVTTESDLAAKRPKLEKCFLFELPSSWVQPGTMKYTMTVDASHTIPETVPNPFANNSVSTPNLSVVQKGSPCLVFVPLWNNSSDYDPLAPNSGFPDLLERAKSLMPVEDFRVFLAGGRIEKPVVNVEFHPECFIPFTFCLPVQVHITNHPFNMPDDKNWALFWTAVYNAFHSNPSGCADTHWIGTLPPDGQGGFNGIGGAKGVKVGDLVDLGVLNGIPIPPTPLDSTAVVRMDPGQGNSSVIWDKLNGGHTLAHELGHNYGRFHIDQTLSGSSCGTQKPDRPWQLNPPYPFDPCTIGPVSYSDPASFFGFDPITRTVIPPDMAGDTMSYADSHWTSKAYWDALLGVVANPPPELSPAPGAPPQLAGPNDSFLFLGGKIHFASNSVELLPAHVVPGSLFDLNFLESSLAALEKLGATLPYRIKLLDLAGKVLSDQPLRFLSGVDGGLDETAFLEITLFPPATDRIQIWSGTQLLSEQFVSAHKPSLALGQPVYQADTHRVHLSWSAADADGDALLFTVLYSPDHGGSWQVIDPAHASEQISIDGDLLPSGSNAQLRVIATDGLQSTIVDSQPFTIPAHNPKVVISGLASGQRVPYGTPISLHGLAYQPEYGTLEANRLHWLVTAPASLQLSATGSSFPLGNLAPGHYVVSLSATGPDNRSGNAEIGFDVEPIQVLDAAAPTLDGVPSDASYESASVVNLNVGPHLATQIRLIHSSDGFLYAGVQGAPYGGNAKTKFTLRIDTQGDGAGAAKADDIGFVVDEDGIASQEVAQGGVFVPTLQPKTGYAAVVTRGPGRWNAELKVSDALLGGWNHKARVSVEISAAGGAAVYRWPGIAQRNSPATWADATFGNVPAPANRPPVAVAGPDQEWTPAAGMTVTVDGSGSYDPDGDAITYLWSQVGGPTVKIVNGTSAKMSFSVDPVTAPVALQFRLVVRDGSLNSPSSDMHVRLLPATLPSTVFTGPTERIKPDGSFCGELAAFGLPGTRFRILASTDLVKWTPIATNSLNYYFQIPFIDTESRKFRHRFYQAVELTRTSKEVYSTGFETGASAEWSLQNVDTTPNGGRKFLGQFGNGGPRLQLGNLPAHHQATLEFDLYLIRSWDGSDPVYGPDFFRVSVVNGPMLLDNTFTCAIGTVNQSYPDNPANGNPPLTGALEHGTLGYPFANVPSLDAVYHFSFQFAHTGSTLAVDFKGAGLQELADESWGLDNVSVRVEENQ